MSDAISMEEVLANSYKNFHSKGLDYICLFRSEGFTQKLYFFDGDVSALPEVVNPHDHRYDFKTWCLSGEVENVLYGPPQIDLQIRPTRFTLFQYRSPLLRGRLKGFSNPQPSELIERTRNTYGPKWTSQSYNSSYRDIHTIAIKRPETVLLINQGEDQVDLLEPTRTWVRGDEAPSLDDLYEKITADEVIAKLTNLADRVRTWNMPVFE